MANGHKRGEVNQIFSVAKASATVIERGDLLYQDEGASNVPKPFADRTWNTDLATTQEEVHDRFLGVALSDEKALTTRKVRVATSGEFEFDISTPGTAYAIGKLMGPAANGTSNVKSQSLVGVATENLAIGYLVKPVTTTDTKCHVRIFSRTVGGGPQAMA